MTLFYIQFEQGSPSVEGAAFIDACMQKNWLDGDHNNFWTWSKDSADIAAKQHGLKNVIPIGSMEFTQSFLQEHGGPIVTAMNIPDELCCEEFLCRSIWNNMTKGDVQAKAKQLGKPLLIKPGKHPKLFEMTTSDYLSEIPDDEPLFVSEKLISPIVAEWRIFVLRQKVVEIKPYILDEWSIPDKSTVESMAQNLKFPACAMDVAVLQSGKTVLIEVHPFISCGLYGFEGPLILQLAKSAWKAHLPNQ